MASVGISNFEIEKIIENSGNDGLQKNFVGVFPSNKIKEFIKLHMMAHERKDTKHSFVFRTWTDLTNWAHIGGAF